MLLTCVRKLLKAVGVTSSIPFPRDLCGFMRSFDFKILNVWRSACCCCGSEALDAEQQSFGKSNEANSEQSYKTTVGTQESSCIRE